VKERNEREDERISSGMKRDRTVVYRAGSSSESTDKVVGRLRAAGVEIVDEQPHMLLVSGAKKNISKAVDDAEGWSITGETTVSHPPTRETIRRK
jgi:hypothetical protein